MSAWNLLPCVIIWVPEGGAQGPPYNYTRQQITCTDVTMLQLLHVLAILSATNCTYTWSGLDQHFECLH